ncbi:TonB-dependent siderophore receptor [Xylophilus sp. Kf1]|nr:TonB-dependent siderophore receptor [Xylophilus sp. Kf1]
MQQKQFIARRTHLARAVASLGFVLSLQSALAQNVTFDIPAQPLSTALAAFARQSGLQLAFAPALAQGRQARPVAGARDVRGALDDLLAGTGLQGRVEGRTLVIQPAPAPPAAPAAATLPAVTIASQAERSPTTEQTGSYTSRALSIGKTEQSIRETPQSVTVVTRQQMDDQRLLTVEEVVAQTTGTAKSQRNFGAHVYTMRGFVIPDSNFLLDGVAGGAYNPTGWVPVDTAIFDRVEVLRGAGALAVGAGDPSGVVNLVRKRPRTERHFEFAQSVGSWDNYRTEVDAGGPLNAAATVRGRVVASYTDRRYFYDLAHGKEPMVYAVVDADLGRDTRATAGYRHQEQGIDGYTIFQLPSYTDGTSLGLPRSTSLGQHWNRHFATTDDLFAELEHHFEGDWRGKVTVNHGKTGITQKLSTARGAINPATRTGLAISSQYFMDRSIDSNGLDANVTGSFQALGGTHKLMFGAAWSQQEILGLSTTVNQNIPADVFHFDHARVPEPATPAYASRLREKTDQAGLYGSARLQLAEPLHLHLGGRLNWYEFRSNDLVAGTVTNDYRQNAQLTPYAGLVYDLGPQWSVYASYAATFVPQSQYATVGGSKLDPAEGDNYEAGVKGELLDRRLNVALAVFDIKKRNVAVLDTGNLGNCPGITTNDCYRSASQLRSKGFDAEAAGQVARGWEVAGGYTYLNTRDDAGTPLTSDAPRNILRASTSYTLPGEWSAWKVGANLSAQSASYVGIIDNPGRALLDLRASYRINRTWTAALNIQNVADRTYWEIVGAPRNGNAYGVPRNATVSIRGSF